MISLTPTALFNKQLCYKFHIENIKKIRASVDTSKPKARLICTKQPLSEFNEILSRRLQTDNLLRKISNSKPTIQSRLAGYKLIKNNRKKYFEEHQRHISNEGLLKRIRSVKTSYSMRKQLQQSQQNKLYIKNLSRFGLRNLSNIKFKFNEEVPRLAHKEIGSQLQSHGRQQSQSSMRKALKSQPDLQNFKQMDLS